MSDCQTFIEELMGRSCWYCLHWYCEVVNINNMTIVSQPVETHLYFYMLVSSSRIYWVTSHMLLLLLDIKFLHLLLIIVCNAGCRLMTCILISLWTAFLHEISGQFSLESSTMTVFINFFFTLCFLLCLVTHLYCYYFLNYQYSVPEDRKLNKV